MMSESASSSECVPEILARLRGVGVVSSRFNFAGLQDVNWEIGERERWVIAGLHASGKTGLLKTAAGLSVPRGGEITLLGHPYWESSDAVMCDIRRKVGFVFEDAGNRLISNLSVAENVALPVRYHENRGLAELRSEILGLLDWLRLGSIAELLPVQLDLFQRYVVALGRTVFLKPRLFFADDPGQGLDVVQRGWLKRLLLEVSGGVARLELPPVTVVVSTQDLRGVLDFGTRYGVITDEGFLTFRSVEALRESSNLTVKKLLGNWSESELWH